MFGGKDVVFPYNGIKIDTSDLSNCLVTLLDYPICYINLVNVRTGNYINTLNLSLKNFKTRLFDLPVKILRVSEKSVYVHTAFGVKVTVKKGMCVGDFLYKAIPPVFKVDKVVYSVKEYYDDCVIITDGAKVYRCNYKSLIMSALNNKLITFSESLSVIETKKKSESPNRGGATVNIARNENERVLYPIFMLCEKGNTDNALVKAMRISNNRFKFFLSGVEVAELEYNKWSKEVVCYALQNKTFRLSNGVPFEIDIRTNSVTIRFYTVECSFEIGKYLTYNKLLKMSETVDIFKLGRTKFQTFVQGGNVYLIRNESTCCIPLTSLDKHLAFFKNDDLVSKAYACTGKLTGKAKLISLFNNRVQVSVSGDERNIYLLGKRIATVSNLYNVTEEEFILKCTGYVYEYRIAGMVVNMLYSNNDLVLTDGTFVAEVMPYYSFDELYHLIIRKANKAWSKPNKPLITNLESKRTALGGIVRLSRPSLTSMLYDIYLMNFKICKLMLDTSNPDLDSIIFERLKTKTVAIGSVYAKIVDYKDSRLTICDMLTGTSFIITPSTRYLEFYRSLRGKPLDNPYSMFKIVDIDNSHCIVSVADGTRYELDANSIRYSLNRYKEKDMCSLMKYEGITGSSYLLSGVFRLGTYYGKTAIYFFNTPLCEVEGARTKFTLASYLRRRCINIGGINFYVKQAKPSEVQLFNPLIPKLPILRFLLTEQSFIESVLKTVFDLLTSSKRDSLLQNKESIISDLISVSTTNNVLHNILSMVYSEDRILTVNSVIHGYDNNIMDKDDSDLLVRRYYMSKRNSGINKFSVIDIKKYLPADEELESPQSDNVHVTRYRSNGDKKKLYMSRDMIDMYSDRLYGSGYQAFATSSQLSGAINEYYGRDMGFSISNIDVGYE